MKIQNKDLVLVEKNKKKSECFLKTAQILQTLSKSQTCLRLLGHHGRFSGRVYALQILNI